MVDVKVTIQDRFDASVDDATHAVLAHFRWLGIPEDMELLVQVNDALTLIFREFVDVDVN